MITRASTLEHNLLVTTKNVINGEREERDQYKRNNKRDAYKMEFETSLFLM